MRTDNGRTLTSERIAQGFRSQAQLDAFYAQRDHTEACTECGLGEGYYGADGWQPSMHECAEALRLVQVSWTV